ncbi:MAG: hypothetical protein ACYCOU_04225 [Sulfobacillus sp.]
MKTPNFSNNQFVDQVALNNGEALTKISLQDIGASLHAPGLLGQSALVIAESGMSLNLTMPLPFRVLFGSGVLASANGTTNGASTDTASVDFTSLVPSTGSVTAYLVANAATVQQSPYQVIGPPLGHPDYNPAFAPYTAYAEIQDTLTFAATLTAPDNSVNIEICRVTLTAGQTVITSAEVSTAYQQLATAVLGDATVQGDLTVDGGATFVGNEVHEGSATHAGAESILSGGSLTVNAGGSFSSVPAASVGAATASGHAVQAAQAKAILIVEEQQPSGTAGGSTTAGTPPMVRQLNTLLVNTIPNAVFNNPGSVTLPIGTYRVSGWGACFDAAPTKAVLYNTTSSAVAIIGSSVQGSTGSTATGVYTHFSGRITLTAQSTLEIQQFFTTASGTNGLGVPVGWAGVNEVYSHMTIEAEPY